MSERLCPTCRKKKHTTRFQFAWTKNGNNDCRKCYRKKLRMGGVDIDRIHYKLGAIRIKEAA